MVPGIVYKVFTAGLEISHYDHRNVNILGIASAKTLGNLPQYTPPRLSSFSSILASPYTTHHPPNGAVFRFYSPSSPQRCSDVLYCRYAGFRRLSGQPATMVRDGYQTGSMIPALALRNDDHPILTRKGRCGHANRCCRRPDSSPLGPTTPCRPRRQGRRSLRGRYQLQPGWAGH